MGPRPLPPPLRSDVRWSPPVRPRLRRTGRGVGDLADDVFEVTEVGLFFEAITDGGAATAVEVPYRAGERGRDLPLAHAQPPWPGCAQGSQPLLRSITDSPRSSRATTEAATSPKVPVTHTALPSMHAPQHSHRLHRVDPWWAVGRRGQQCGAVRLDDQPCRMRATAVLADHLDDGVIDRRDRPICRVGVATSYPSGYSPRRSGPRPRTELHTATTNTSASRST